MKLFWFSLCLAATILHLGLVGVRIRDERGRLLARDDLRRLTKATLQFFTKGAPPTGPIFWQTIGRAEPLRDPWGSFYVLDHPSTNEFRWRSAAQDRLLGTSDDLASQIPFGDGVGIDFTQPQLQDPGSPPALDVR